VAGVTIANGGDNTSIYVHWPFSVNFFTGIGYSIWLYFLILYRLFPIPHEPNTTKLPNGKVTQGTQMKQVLKVYMELMELKKKRSKKEDAK